MSSTRIAYFRALAHRLYDNEQDVVTGVSTGGSTTTVVDALALKYTDADANTYDRRYVYNEASGETGKVDEDGYADTGTITISPANSTFVTDSGTDDAGVTTTATTLTDSREAWTIDEWIGYNVTCEAQSLLITSNSATVLTGAGWSGDGTPATNKAWEITPKYVITGDRPQVLKGAINDVLRNISPPSFFPLSMHVMGNDANDMEASTIATDYTAENSGTLATESTIVHGGAQSLKVEAGAALSGASTGNISVYEGKSYYAAVMCSVKQGDDADFRAVNVQDSDAQIDDNATTDEPSWTELVIQFTPPSGCEQVDIFMLGTANSDIAYFEDFQTWASGRDVYSLPSWITHPGQMLDVRSFPRGAGGPASDNDYRANEQRSQPLAWGWESVDPRGSLRIWVHADGGRPFICADRPFAELTTDSATSAADEDKVVFWAEKLVREPERASLTLALLRTQYHVRPVTVLPDRVAVR